MASFSRRYAKPRGFQARRGRNTQNYIWTEETEDKLLDLYEAHDHLYDMKSPGYSNRTKRTHTMVKFSEELGVPVSEVEKHLRSLRTQYGRERKGQRHGGDPPKSRRAALLLSRLEFLEPHMKSRKARTPRKANHDDNDYNDDSSDRYDDLEQDITDNGDDEIYEDYVDQGQEYSDSGYDPLCKEEQQEGTNIIFPEPSSLISQQNTEILHYMSRTIAETVGQNSDEDSLWGKMIVKKMKRIPKQEDKEDLMMHIDLLVTQAIRGHLPPLLTSNSQETCPQHKEEPKL